MPIERAMDDFVTRLRENVEALQRRYGVGDLVAARKAGTVPRRGVINGVRFLFHGNGLQFELADRLVDVDFSAEGMEVDWWRFGWFLAEERATAEAWREAYVAACPTANGHGTIVGGRRLVWRAEAVTSAGRSR